MDNCCNPIQYYSTLFFFLSSFFFFFLTFTLSTSPLFVSKPLQSFYRQIQEKNLSMVLEKYSSFLYIYIYWTVSILARLHISIDQNYCTPSSLVIFFRKASRNKISNRTIMLRDWILARDSSVGDYNLIRQTFRLVVLYSGIILRASVCATLIFRVTAVHFNLSDKSAVSG